MKKLFLFAIIAIVTTTVFAQPKGDTPNLDQNQQLNQRIADLEKIVAEQGKVLGSEIKKINKKLDGRIHVVKLGLDTLRQDLNQNAVNTNESIDTINNRYYELSNKVDLNGKKLYNFKDSIGTQVFALKELKANKGELTKLEIIAYAGGALGVLSIAGIIFLMFFKRNTGRRELD